MSATAQESTRIFSTSSLESVSSSRTQNDIRLNLNNVPNVEKPIHTVVTTSWIQHVLIVSIAILVGCLVIIPAVILLRTSIIPSSTITTTVRTTTLGINGAG
ncbi:unnamed protein product [Rotaria magnacalcarata]|uniref:Uncharacterized protein n=1 Tax=Rotaria magnacalcarata TaxID=392030 RepID=A0A816NL70_9BILA|nr:unnamed protein product [Rotaria magnacalcarata]CAF1416477.1 unnamed protein product [Rotaria magnacalcarata]CAF2032192.1 unnamed protein product [Rotaria magnacalcarata]CAF2035930.1 unnamed protein product [Rotaria magnacalcarata]CAF2080260.1 unnamed protein product [Rotaria magnacalcarata]